MTKTRTLFALMAGLALTSAIAYATPPDKTVVYANSPMGKVTFNSANHIAKGKTCDACHPALFPMAPGTKVTMAEHDGKKLCFSCHDKTADCTKCHVK